MDRKDIPRNWELDPMLQREDWEPERPSGSVTIGDRNISGMTCEEAKLMVAAPRLLAVCLQFVEKCDNGRARSVETYSEMSDIIKTLGG